MSDPYMSTATPSSEIPCPHCGRPNAPRTHFCNWCGKPLAGATTVPGAYPPQQLPQAPAVYPPSSPPPAPYYQPGQSPQQPPQVVYMPPPLVQSPYPPYAPVPAGMAYQPRKSLAVAFLLSFFFGPLGMFYSTIAGAVTMILVSVAAWTLFFVLVVGRMGTYDPGFTTSGISWVTVLAFGILIAVQIACIVWAMAAAASHNNKMLAR